MASTPFTYKGADYVIDDQGNIANAQGQPVEGALATDVGLWQAAAVAQATPTDAGAPAGNTPPRADATLNAYGTRGEPAVSGLGTSGSAPPPEAPAPATAAAPVAAPAPVVGPRPPRGQVGSAVEERVQLKDIQDQIAKLQNQADPSTGLTNSQNSLLASLNARATGLSQTIDRIETAIPPINRVVTGSAANPNDAYITHFDPATGTLIADKNPNHTGQITPQVVTHGNQTFVITPPTQAELQTNPAAPPHTTVAYTDTDAKALADRQTAVAEGNARTAAAAQAATAWAAKAANDLATRVSNGEDAASVRAQQLQESNQLHQAWVEADGDARRATAQLDSYNANRHADAATQLGQDQLKQVAAQQAAQDATTRRGQDISQHTSQYATDTAAKTARVNAGNVLLQNSLSALAEINKALPPGSALAGQALEGMMRYGQKFLEGMSNGPDAVAAKEIADKVTPGQQPATTAPTTDPTTGAGIPSWQRADAGTTTPDQATGLAPAGAAGTVAPDSPNYMGMPLDPSLMPGAGSGPVAPPVGAPPPSPIVAQATADPGQELAAANTAAHQANMAAPVTLHPDGSPIATPADVARVFGRGMG